MTRHTHFASAALRLLLAAAVLSLMPAALPAQGVSTQPRQKAAGKDGATSAAKSTKPKEYPTPLRYEKDIAKFEAEDAKTSPPVGAIVCVGSSSMRGWHKTITQDLAPLTVIPRGFGGSTMNDALYYADRVVIAYRPRAVVVYEGDNDISMGMPAERVRDGFAELVGKIRRSLPEARIYYMSTKPSPSRWAKWPEMQRANELIRSYCAQGKGLTYIDVATPMFDSATGQPKPEIFLKDRLHMNDAGYRIWTQAVKPVLMEKEGRFEKK